MLQHFDLLGQLTLLLVQSCVLLLFFSELGCSLQQSLEAIIVTLILEQINLGHQLLPLLLKLVDLFFQLGWVHAIRPHALDTLMDSLELSLKVLVHLHGLAHFFVDHELVRDLKGHQEASSVGLALQVWQP